MEPNSPPPCVPDAVPNRLAPWGCDVAAVFEVEGNVRLSVGLEVVVELPKRDILSCAVARRTRRSPASAIDDDDTVRG